jgi:phage baseplate assembly protein W
MTTDAHLLTDLRLEPRDALSPPTFRIADTQDDLPRPAVYELEAVAERANLAQALTMRLLTPRGELAALGHPAYGSRLHELLGRPNTATSRGLVRLAVLEALTAERRIAAVVSVEVNPVASAPHNVAVEAVVQPIPPGEVVRIGPIILELAG